MKLHTLTAHELAKLLISREVSSEELTRALYEHIGKTDKQIGAYITLTKDIAIEQAREADKRIKKKRDIGPLTGIPIAIKDNMCIKDVLCTCGSKMLSSFIPPYNGTVINKLKKCGLVFLGKTNMDEFAMGSSTETSYFKVTRNPWNIKTIPGGSSGGSAAAVASDQAVLSIGSDTGGSIRQPASHCGIVGMKPTYGRVSRYGLVAFASSLDQIGPLTKDVWDCAALLEVISGYDPLDSTSLRMASPDYMSFLNKDIKNIKIGVPKEYFIEGIDKDVELAVKGAIEKLENLGATIEEISLPHTEYAVATYYIIAPAETSANLARYDGVEYGYRAKGEGVDKDLLGMYENTRKDGFGAEVKRRIMLGTHTLSSGYYDAYYLKAQKVRTLIKQDFDKAFKGFDILVTPTSPTPAFKIGEKIDDPLQMYLSDIFTIPTNLAGLPAISIPCGVSKNGLPIGLQLIGNYFDEGMILQVAHAFEKNMSISTY
ncbi:MAG: Asp-tRNA(Asn)/Glu-tRNA(Gln) amidotransferase subunit GatA [bacterium]|nr:Asp-tRNA(Asn)/Glu-tRNA(Gln) amidotransferase subunit GatA [bacterium]